MMKSLLLILPIALTAAYQATEVEPGHARKATTAPGQLDMQTARMKLVAADRGRSTASSKGLLGGFATALSDDVVFLYPGQPILRGRGATIGFLGSLPNIERATLTWKPVRWDVSSDGSRGYTSGYGEEMTSGPDSSARSPMRYISFWAKSTEGWRVTAWVISKGGAHDPKTAPKGCEPPSYRRYPVFPAAGATAAGSAVLAADSTFAARSAELGPEAAFGTFVAVDGASLGGAAGMACGRTAIQSGFGAFKPGEFTWTPQIGDVAPSGDLGFTVGVATIRSSSEVFHSKYLTIWKRQPTGEWKFVADGGNAAPAPTR